MANSNLIMDIAKKIEDVGGTLLIKLISIVIIIIVAILLIKLANTLIDRLVRNRISVIQADDRRIATVRSLTKSLIKYIILFVAVMAVLSQFVDVTVIVAAAGIGGVALSLGARDLISDVVSGLFILAENNFAIQEYITIGGLSGSVEKITLRTTHLKDTNGDVHIINNGSITAITNHSRNAYNLSFVMLVPFETEKGKKRITKAVKEIGIELKNKIPDVVEGPVLEVDSESGDSAVNIYVTLSTALKDNLILEQSLKEKISKGLAQRDIKISNEDIDIEGKETKKIIFRDEHTSQSEFKNIIRKNKKK